MQDNLEQTQGTIDRMILLGKTMRPIISMIGAVNSGVLFGILGALINPDYWVFFALIGMIAGLAAGIFLAGALSVLLEWMAQLLVRINLRN